jgi:hypothetical protein
MTQQKPRRPYSRTGLNALKARVKVRGLHAIDQRTLAGRALVRWRKELVTTLGGPDAVTPQRQALIDLAVRTRLFVDHVDAWLMEQSTLVGGRGRRRLLPVLIERQQLAESLARVLGQLGLERVAPPAPRLAEVLAARTEPAAADRDR